MRWLPLVLLLVGCGSEPVVTEPAPPPPPERPTEVYRLPLEQIDELLALVATDLEAIPLLTGIDQAGSQHRLERLQAVLQDARLMAAEQRFNQNAVTKYRILRERYQTGGFSPLSADTPLTPSQRAEFDAEMDRLAKGFGEHDSDHLPWLEDGP